MAHVNMMEISEIGNEGFRQVQSHGEALLDIVISDRTFGSIHLDCK